MTGRDLRPTTRQRSQVECLSVIPGPLSRTLCLLAAALVGATAWGQDVPAIRSGSAGTSGGAVSEMGGTKAGVVDAKKSTSPETSAVPVEQGAVDPPSAPVEPAAPPFHVSQVEVEGVISGDRADLQVRINVEVNRASGWHDVPLRLGQASIYRQQSSGVGSRLPGQPALQDDGLHWRFFGQGQHTLEFDLGVPVRSTPAGRQMQLSLPLMPPLFEAQLRLRIPGGNFAARSTNRDAALKADYDKGKNETTVEGGIPGGRLELAWQDRNQRPAADGVASSIFTLRRRGSLMELEAQQSLVRMESPSNEMVVRLPDGFEVEKVEGALLDNWSIIPDRPGWLRLVFVEGTSDRIELLWKLQRSFPVSGGTLELTGFEIEGVRTHDGRIRIMPVAGFQLAPLQSSLRYVERIEDSPSPGDPSPLLAYSFSASDWRIGLELSPVEPLFACRPRLDLVVREDQASLTATFELREEAGEVSRLAVDVAALEAAGWLPATGPRPAAPGVTMTRTGSVINFEWNGSPNGKKVAELRFERDLTGAEFDFVIPAPVPRATWIDTATVAVRAADALRIDVDAATPVSETQLDASTPSISSRPIGVFQPAVTGAPIAIHGSLEARTVAATANILVEGVESRRVTVEQQIALDVRYGRMDALRLLIPEGFPVTQGAERLAFQVWVDGREATDLEWTSGAIRVPFVRPRIGLIRVVVRYALPRQAEQSRATVPVVMTPDVKYHELTMEASSATRVGVDPTAALWKEIVTSSDRRRWSADPQSESVELLFEKERTAASERAVISTAFIRTEAAAGGVHRTIAEYDISRSGETLAITLPFSATPHEIIVNGRPAEVVRENDAASENQWIVRMPQMAGATSTRLQVSYDVVPSTPRGAVGRMKVTFPQFPAGTFVNQLVWRLTLAESDVLLNSPPGMTRLFEWQRRGVFWRRVLSPAYLSALRNASFVAPDSDLAIDAYAFRQIGGPPSLVVWTIDRSLVILFGAGVTLVLGFAFWTIRSMQNVVVMLGLAFLISLAGLWFPEAIQVLIQPALIGAVMAMIATAVDGRTRRRRYRTPSRESSVQPAVRTQSPVANDPLRSTILRPTGSDHGVAR